MRARISKTVLGFFQGSVAARHCSPLDLLPGAGQANEDRPVLLKGAQHRMSAFLRQDDTVEDDLVPSAQKDIDARVSTAANESNVDRRPIVLQIGTVEYGLRKAIQNGVH